MAAESTLRKTVARLIASFQISDRDASRLQCSVARIAAASGPNGWSLAGEGAAVAPSAWGAIARSGPAALPGSLVVSITEPPRAGRVAAVPPAASTVGMPAGPARRWR